MLKDHTVSYFVDVDKTVIDDRKREAYAGKEPDRRANPAAYTAWLRRMMGEVALSQDTPIPEMVQKIQLLRDSGATVVFLTAREAVWREVTQAKLNEIGLHDIPLLMRPPGNVLRSGEYKTAILGLQRMKYPHTPVAMIDDDPDGLVAFGCKALGIDFYKTSYDSEGNFHCIRMEVA